MGIIRVDDTILNNQAIMEALDKFFDSMYEIDHDRYRKTKDFRVQGSGVPTDDVMCTIKIYYPDGVKPFVIEVDS